MTDSYKVRRRRRLLTGIDVPGSRGVEFGPLDKPIVRKSEGNILYLDYTTADELRRTHANSPKCANIVEVDRVCRESVHAALERDAPLDYALASHVIEHVPDLVGWLADIAAVLRPGGRLCLAVPDKRYTFDVRRNPTRVPEVVDAWLNKQRHPSSWQVLDHHVWETRVTAHEAWREGFTPDHLARRHTFKFAVQRAKEALAGGYVDCHCWVFTPSTFLHLLSELVGCGLVSFRLNAFFDTEPDQLEFFAILEHDPAIASDAGAREQARLSFLARIPADPPRVAAPPAPAPRAMNGGPRFVGSAVRSGAALLRRWTRIVKAEAGAAVERMRKQG